jgi:hypothetical protein
MDIQEVIDAIASNGIDLGATKGGLELRAQLTAEDQRRRNQIP